MVIFEMTDSEILAQQQRANLLLSFRVVLHVYNSRRLQKDFDNFSNFAKNSSNNLSNGRNNGSSDGS